MRLAALDFGSNTTGYLLGEAEGGVLRPGERVSRFVRLGEGVATHGVLAAAALERTLRWVDEIARRFEQFRPELRRAVGTEALRRARNRDVLKDEVRRRLDVELEVVSGEEEGRLTFQGVRFLYPEGPLAILDIGGGSTEVVLGAGPGEREEAVSFPIGAVNLTERHGEDWAALGRTVEESLAGFRPRPPLPPEVTVLGGTGANLALMDAGLKELEGSVVEGRRLSRARVQDLRARCQALSPEERVARHGVPPRRADVMIASLAILEGVLEAAGFREVRTSRGSLRHGVLCSLLPAARSDR